MGEEIVFGNYIAREHLKTDGVIEIYRGTTAGNDARVLIKALPAEYAGNPEVVRRFLWEATVSERLKGLSCVVPLLQKGTASNGMPYYVLPAFETTLSSIVQKADRFPLADRARIARNVLEGLAGCHSRGVVHRNLKPGSVAIDVKTRTALLSEFGLAKVGQQDVFGHEERTFDDAQYSSPEQAELRPVDERSDVYAAGALLYELFAGRKPFVGDTTDAIQLQKIGQGAPPLRKWNPEVTPALEAVVHRALSRNPAERQANGRDLLSALDDALRPAAVAAAGGASQPAAPPSTAAPSRKVIPPRKGVPMIDLGGASGTFDREDVFKPEADHLDIGDKTDGFSRDVLGHAEHHSRRQAWILAVVVVVAVAVGLFFLFRNMRAQQAADEDQRRIEQQKLDEEKAKQALAEEKAKLQTEADELQRAGDFQGAMAKHDEVLAKDPASEASKKKKEELAKKMDLVKAMILVKGARFKAGIDTELIPELVKKHGGRADQLKAAAVTEKFVDAFFIDRREVTNAEYRLFLDANPGVKLPASSSPDDADFSWKNGTYPEGKGDHPVVLVTWDDAAAYAKWAGKRLPTSVEWEMAARGAEQRFTWPWGNAWDKNKANTASGGKDGPTPVGSYADGASPYGLVDMVGNASEWTSDLYEDGKKKLAGIAGSSWADEDGVTPVALRFSQETTARKATIGFRCAVSP